MRYVVEYQATALLYLSFVVLHYIHKRGFPSVVNRAFGVVLILTFSSLATDLLTAFTITHVFAMPFWVNYLLNTMFYTIQVMMPVSMMVFVMALAGIHRQPNFRRRFLITLLPAGLQLLHLAVNSFTHTVFYLDADRGLCTAGGFSASIFFPCSTC
jgi:hypothetical protein